MYQFHKADKISLKMKAKAVLDNFIKSDPTKNDINTNWCTIKSILNNLLNDYVPYRTTKSRHNLPWITNEIKRSMRKRDRLFHRARKSYSNIDWANFRKFRNSVAKTIISSHKNYINNIIGSNLVENPKCFWSYVRLKRTDNIGVPTLKTGNKVCNSDIDKAEALNDHFHSVFSIPNRKITLFDGVSPFESIPSLSIDACGVLSQLRQLNPNKAQGPDELSPQLLKLVAEELAPALTIIFQQSYDLSSTPKDWNSAIVTPIYKKGLKSDPSNYRPISLTCICCKIMEHIMLSHIAKHIAKNNIIINEQHGFRNKLSTITQLINTTTDWANTLNNKGQTDIIFLDFSKAFDKISHKFLLSKIHHYGIRNHTLSWIGAFLSNRTQTTVVNGVHSSYVEVASGVPQGSVLGPMLFLLYINDINNAIKSQIKLFADDSVLYRNIRNQNDQVILQNDLDTISSWAEKWLMELNINKCSVLSITLKRNSIFHDYNIIGATLRRVTNHDYLGVTILSDLNWLRHVTKISNKASRTLGLLKRTLSPCSQNVKSIAYKMLVRPQLEYASEVWSPYTMKCIKKIEQIQRNSCRFIFHEYCRDTDTSLLINRLNLDSLYARRLIQQATMFYKIHYSLVDICPPSYIQHANHISSRTDHPLKYCNKNPLQINAYKYSFFPRSMFIWNRLPCSAVSHVIPSVDNFHKFAIPAIRDMQPLYGAALI